MSKKEETGISKGRISRRTLLKSGAATAALLGAVKTQFPFGVSIAQAAINYLLHRPCVHTVLIGARNETQLRENLGAAGWQLSAEEQAALDTVSRQALPYPYWHQGFYGALRNPTYAAMYQSGPTSPPTP